MYFNYFLPNRDKVTLDELLAMGLGYVFEPEAAASPRDNFAPRGVTSGPGGQHGLIVSLSSEHCGYYQHSQVWKQEIDCDYWVGMRTDKRPTPETLQRENVIEGGLLRLDDGHVWMLPKARHFEEFDGEIVCRRTLPARLTRYPSGQWFAGEVKERYRELWRLSTEYLEAHVSAVPDAHGMVRLSFSEIDNLVIEAFKCNYKVSAIELDLLGVYDDAVRDRVLNIVTDTDGWSVLVKKKLTRLATGSSTAGPVESPLEEVTEPIDQPQPT